MMLPENIFPLSNDRDAPGEKDADPFGSVMYFCTRYGWMDLKAGDITKSKRTGRLSLYWEPVGGNYTAEEKHTLAGFYEVPCMGELEEMTFDSMALTPAEDAVEPDHPDSWLMLLGLI
jgi:hypothetical protein